MHLCKKDRGKRKVLEIPSIGSACNNSDALNVFTEHNSLSGIYMNYMRRVPLSERPYVALTCKEVTFHGEFHTCSIIETSQRHLKLVHEGPWDIHRWKPRSKSVCSARCVPTAIISAIATVCGAPSVCSALCKRFPICSVIYFYCPVFIPVSKLNKQRLGVNLHSPCHPGRKRQRQAWEMVSGKAQALSRW